MNLHSKRAALASLTAVDAFCGAGGLSLGLRQAGFDVRFAFDSNAKAIETYRMNLGEHGHVADAKKLTTRTFADCLGGEALTLFAGGPPCQGFSVQRRGGDDDSRNELIFEFLRFVQELKPAVFLMENVAALASKKNSRHLDAFVAAANHAGYNLDVKVLNAADFGVPQTRKRLFVLGTHVSLPSQVRLPDGQGQPWVTVRQAIGDLSAPARPPLVPNHIPDNMSPLNRRRIAHVPSGGGRADIPEGLRLPCHAVPVETAGHRGVYGRLDWDRPSGTITTKCNSFTRGRFAHPEQNRNISMREAARLQSFPDDFVFAGGTVDVAHQVGNAVPPVLAFEVASSILEQVVAMHEAMKDQDAVI